MLHVEYNGNCRNYTHNSCGGTRTRNTYVLCMFGIRSMMNTRSMDKCRMLVLCTNIQMYSRIYVCIAMRVIMLGNVAQVVQ